MEYFVKYLGLWMQSCWRVDFLSKILMTPGWVKSDPQKENFLKYFKTWQMIAMIWFEHIPTSNSEKVVVYENFAKPKLFCSEIFCNRHRQSGTIFSICSEALATGSELKEKCTWNDFGLKCDLSNNTTINIHTRNVFLMS